eukprot:GFKZ01000125.1.p1 GENE.GFKZ01000125.1~~GFKZ01000125.1.p1  ORF type:complete len:522 (-),score=58.72 GFKZ01000125.1:1075-2640(-)
MPLPAFIPTSPTLSLPKLPSRSSISIRPNFRPPLSLTSSFIPASPIPPRPALPNHSPSLCPPAPSNFPRRLTPKSAILTPNVLLAMGGLVAFALSAALGANDVANSLGTAVGTGAIKVTAALAIGAVMEFAGAVLFGSTVTKTISAGVVTIGTATLAAPVSYMLGMLAVLVGCTVWMAIATRFGLPVSSTHSVVGALIGLGLVSGWGINYGAVKRIVMSWFLSPMIGGMVATCLYKAVSVLIVDTERPAKATRRFLPVLSGGASFVLTMFVLGKGARFGGLTPDRVFYIALAVALACSGVAGALATAIHSKQYIAKKFGVYGEGYGGGGVVGGMGGGDLSRGEQQEDVERIFKVLQVVTACMLAFSHGSNDVSNAIGPFAAMYSMWVNNGSLGSVISIPPWVLVLGGLGISCGLGLFGRPVMETVGTKITKLKPTMGFSVELSTALTVLIASELGLPVSTTHTLVGCIVAIGLANGDRSAVNRKVLMNIAGSWGVTLPVSALVTIAFYAVMRPFLPVVPAF